MLSQTYKYFVFQTCSSNIYEATKLFSKLKSGLKIELRNLDYNNPKEEANKIKNKEIGEGPI